MRLGRRKSDDAADESASAPTIDPAVAPPSPTAETDFDMRTVGIEPESYPPQPAAPVATPATPPADPSRRKGPLPPTATDINSVGVAILPGVPLPAWVSPVPAPVAQYPIDPAYPTQALPEPPVTAADTPPLAPPDSAASWPSTTPDTAPLAEPSLTPAPTMPPPAMPPPDLMAAPVPPMVAPVAALPPPTTPPPTAPAVAAPPTAPATTTGASPLPPPDPAQWSEHPMGPVVWGTLPPAEAVPLPPVASAASTPTAPPVPPTESMPEPAAGSAAPTAAAVPAADTAWFQTGVDATPVSAEAPSQQYSWLVEPDQPGQDVTAAADVPPATAGLSAPPATPLPTPAGELGEPESDLGPAPAVESAAVSGLLAMAPPAGPALDFTPPADLATITDSTEPDPSTNGDAGSQPPEDADETAAPKSGGGALKWILIVGGILIAAALAAMAAFVTPGFLNSSESSTDTPAAVATPPTAGGLTKAAEPAQPATGVFQKMAADTAAAAGSQYATYTGSDVSATVWVAPAFGGSPASIAQAYGAAGGIPLDKAATVPAGPKGGSMQCAAASPKQTLCFWTAEGVRGAADVTGLGRSAAGELVGKMRVALEPTTPS